MKQEDLDYAQNAALETTAAAFKCIDRYRECSAREQADHLGNVSDARYFASSAMVHLAMAAGGESDDRIRDILEGYGLQHLLYK